ncbi:CmNV_035-like protein [Aratus pisonii nudivirus]|nr:CmNV_035-like protein [Aratus pisonii nudivirus]
MKLIDIFVYITRSYTCKTAETLLIWLSNYDLYSRILFIKIFMHNRVQLIWKKYSGFNDNFQNKHVKNCDCPQIFEDYVKPLMDSDKINNVWFLKNCIGKFLSNVNRKDNKILKFDSYMELKPYNGQRIHFNEGINKPNKFKFVTDTKNFGMKSNDQINIKYYDTFIKRNQLKVEDVIDKMNVCDLYVFLCVDLPTLSKLDSLLPEDLRMETKRNRLKNTSKICSENMLLNIYNFYNREVVFQTNTMNKMTAVLPNIIRIKNPIDDIKNEYFYQPKIAGIRLFICKSAHNQNVIIMNDNHKKLNNISCKEIQNLKNDISSSYSGEFLLVLYNRETEEYLSKEHLLRYIESDSKNKNFTIKLILLDLYMLQSVNLLIDTYERRYKLFDQFIDLVKHNNIIVKIKNYSSIAEIYELYSNYLSNCELNTSIKGIVYRKKDVVYQCNVKVVEFINSHQKHIFISQFDVKVVTLTRSNPTALIEDGNYCHIPSEQANEFINCVCYEISNNIIKTAIFDKNQFKPFYDIICDFNPYTNLTNQINKIKVNNELYSWIMIQIRLKNKQVTNIKFYPEKSLLDCMSTPTWF